MPVTYSFFSSTSAIENNKWLHLLPAVAVGAVGAACIPHFALGLAIGVCQCVVSFSISTILSQMSLISTERNSIFENKVREDIIAFTLFFPLIEELLFRGIVQPLLLLMMGGLFSLSLTAIFSETTAQILFGLFCCQSLGLLKWGILILSIAVFLLILPQLMSIAIFGAGINAVSLGVVSVTAMIFGAAHLMNEHKNAPVQAIFATIAGIILGLLALQYGLLVSIAAHMTNNTLSAIGMLVTDKLNAQEQTASDSSEFAPRIV